MLIKEQWENSAPALHQKDCDGTILWEQTETLKVETNRFDRKVREACEIQYHKCGPKDGGMNLDMGQYVKTQFWTPFFRYLKGNKERMTTLPTARIEANAVR